MPALLLLVRCLEKRSTWSKTVTSRNGIPIRLTDERCVIHISEEHGELAGLRLEVLETVVNPKRIFAGGAGELLATRPVEAKWPVAVYRELDHDGFVITAFLTRRITSLKGGNSFGRSQINKDPKFLPKLKESREGLVWMSYDAGADTLYVNYKKPSHATDSELTDDDVIVRYEGEEVVGYTILHASQR